MVLERLWLRYTIQRTPHSLISFLEVPLVRVQHGVWDVLDLGLQKCGAVGSLPARDYFVLLRRARVDARCDDLAVVL